MDTLQLLFGKFQAQSIALCNNVAPPALNKPKLDGPHTISSTTFWTPLMERIALKKVFGNSQANRTRFTGLEGPICKKLNLENSYLTLSIR